MINCPYTDTICNKVKQYNLEGGCDWAQLDIDNECGDYGICRLTGEYLLGEKDEE